MSDYGSRGYGSSGPDDQGWPGGNSGGRGGDYGGGYGDQAGRDGARGDYGQGGGYGAGGYGGGGYGSGGDYGRGGNDGYGSGGYGSGGDYGRGDAGGGFGASYDDYPSPPRTSGTASVSGSGYGSHEEPLTSGRARVTGADATGPGRARGSARVGGSRRSGRELSEEEAAALKKAKKKKKRRRRLIAMGCVVVMMLGIGTVVGSIFFEQVPLPEEIEEALNQSSTINFSNGDEMAKVGVENRQVLNDIPDVIKDALVAAEDNKFWEHGGVDFWGVMRALFNNLTGGERQGASTLEQQYVGYIADIRDDDSYFRKANEAVMAMKLGDAKSKDEIITDYLNLMPFGRGTNGIGAAAKTFFDKEADKLDASEAALLIGQLKASGGSFDPRDPLGLGEEQVQEDALDRMNYVLDQMVKLGTLKKDARAEFTELPETQELGASGADVGHDEDTGFVSHNYALNEAAEILELTPDEIKVKGYEITTTIDKKLQQAAVDVASRKDGSVMDAQNKNLQAALVSVDPKTGAVRSYFGGTTDGTGADKAGPEHLHPPGSSFKEFTMIAALEEGISFESLWDGKSPRTFEERGDNDGDGQPDPVVNADGQPYPDISMIKSIRQSLNTPIYAMTNQIGAGKVLATAAKMGVTGVQDPVDGSIIDLTDPDFVEELETTNNQREVVDNEVGFGQYPVSVTDMAVANATLAAGGVYREPHFVQEIKDSEGTVVWDDGENSDGKLTKSNAISEGVANDATYVSSDIVPNDMGDARTLENGQPIAGKTGTWERECDDGVACDQNSAIWYAGFAPQLSTAVWVGDKKDENGIVEHTDGSQAYGATISGSVWYQYMEKAMAAMKIDPSKIEALPEPSHVGDASKGENGTGKTEDDDEEDDEDDNEDDCKPGSPNYPDCQGGDNPDECVPGQDGYPDCNGDGKCDFPEGDPRCEEGGGEEPDCKPGDPGWPNCDEGGDGPSGDSQENLNPNYGTRSSTGATWGEDAVREEHALATTG